LNSLIYNIYWHLSSIIINFLSKIKSNKQEKGQNAEQKNESVRNRILSALMYVLIIYTKEND